MRAGITTAALLLLLLPLPAAARHDRHHRHAKAIDRTNPPAEARPSVAPSAAAGIAEVNLDAREGKSLRQLLTDIEADVEWGNENAARRIVRGTYNGSRTTVIKQLLRGLNYAAYRDHARLRIIVAPMITEVVALSGKQEPARPSTNAASPCSHQ